MTPKQALTVHYNTVSTNLPMRLHPKSTIAVTLAFFSLGALFYAIEISINSFRVAQKCEKRVINGENVIVCCDKDGKNCART